MEFSAQDLKDPFQVSALNVHLPKRSSRLKDSGMRITLLFILPCLAEKKMVNKIPQIRLQTTISYFNKVQMLSNQSKVCGFINKKSMSKLASILQVTA